MKIISVFTLIFLVVGSLVQTGAVGASTCPNASTIFPCACAKYSQGIEIRCSGSAVDQTSIENSFRELRRVNEIPEDGGVDIYLFKLADTELAQLDLAPFYRSRMDFLYILGNTDLTKLVNSDNLQDYRSIHVDQFYLGDSRINREGFGDALKYFSNEMTLFSALDLDLSYHHSNKNDNNNTDESESEFLPGLSALTNLTSLTLHTCNITGRLNGSHFAGFPALQSIYLGNNKIDGIGENVFPSSISFISIAGNKLDETSFHPNSGIARAGRRTVLSIESNPITSLPAPIFQTYLDAHPDNYLYLFGDLLICDERLSWLKSRREEFQNRVPYADCRNDPGHDAFDSDLIPNQKKREI